MRFNYTNSITACLAFLALVFSSTLGAAVASNNDPKAVVQRLYAAFDAGDLEAVKALIADNATWTYYGPDYIVPFAGVFHGPQGVGEFFRIVDETLAQPRAGQREFLVSGDQVAVPGWEESIVKATGAWYRVDNVHLFTVRDGKITRFEEFINSSDVVEGFLPADASRGKALFTTCAGCHGSKAEGRAEIGAPNLVGLGSSYLIRQLRNFRNGLRGNSSDTHGFMMIGRASVLPGDRGVRDVVAYIETNPSFTAPSRLKGDARRGSKFYAPCAACHGDKAQGNDALNAPALWQLDDQYMVRQLNNFAAGVRGTAAADVPGQQMRAMAGGLRDPAAVRDVVAYVKSLKPAE